MDSTIRPLYLCLSIIWSYVVCEATYTASQEVDCDPSSNLPCSTDVKYQDLTYGVTEDIEIALKFRFTGQTCQNPKISMQFVQQDFESSNEYLKVYDGAATTDPELAQCGTVEGYAIGDCGYHNCLDAKALGNTNMIDEVNLMIFVEKNVDGLHHSSSNGEQCPGGYNLDAKLTLDCDDIVVHTESQQVTCDFSTMDADGASCSADVVYEDLIQGVTSDIEYVTTFSFPNLQCFNPRLSLDFVQQDFGEDDEFLKVYDGDTTTSSELAQCGTLHDTDCGYHSCLDDRELDGDARNDEVSVTILVSAEVDGLNDDAGQFCEGNNLDAKLTLTCDACNAFETCSRLGLVESDVASNTGRLDTAEPVVASNTGRLDTAELKVVALESAVQTLEETMRKMRASLAAYSGATAAPLGMNDYVLLVLGMVNVVLLTILLVHCSYTRASKTVPYGKVLAYDTESA